MAAELASRIGGVRRALGLAQSELARRAGISASYLSRIEGAAWERGGPWPADGVLRALARALGLSSTELIALRGEARAASPLARANGRSAYAVSVGSEMVDAAARRLVDRNPRRGTLRSAQVYPAGSRLDPSYLDAVGVAMAADPEAMLYRVCVAGPREAALVGSTVVRSTGGRPPEEARNVLTRVTATNPLVMDVLVGDNEVLLAVPDRRGQPHLRAGIIVDDPDFVAAIRAWFDEEVWDAADRASGAEEHLHPARPVLVRPGAEADLGEAGVEAVVAV